MITNILLLKKINDTIKSNENLLDDDAEKKVYVLKREFQNKYVALCANFMNDYNKIIEEMTNKCHLNSD
jgi:hypothetical protein